LNFPGFVKYSAAMKTLFLSAVVSLVLGLHAAVAGDAGWLTNYKQALEVAAKENRIILLDFTGSDWCPPCMKLHEDIFAQPAFAAYAKDNLVAVELDFPRRKELDPAVAAQNKDLAEKFNVEGFPTLILLSPEGKELARRVGYFPGGVEALKSWVAGARK
jgi:thioredoxin-related protein